MSPEMTRLVARMLKEISTMTHCYRSIIEGCYSLYIEHHHYVRPEESMDEVVDYVIERLNYIDSEDM